MTKPAEKAAFPDKSGPKNKWSYIEKGQVVKVFNASVVGILVELIKYEKQNFTGEVNHSQLI
ncbi:uncharacterized protein N7458_007432 [Penicillium daleae]|uniref:Uncharacterized protein n=1 Tax=Penicillium daleae TaxID=63821 RepID=A0AAD6G127_9EURO|nr:uncharacterized protein N7458_007432 [Penicillium daleae]KAJ5443560.1 hypothetical protein N7458_007432 [Penicillium daleae]